MWEWQGNDGHFQIKVNPLDIFWGSSRPIRGLDFELSTNRKPRFWQFLAVSSILITAILSSFRHSTIILSFKSHHQLPIRISSQTHSCIIPIPRSFNHPWIIPVILSEKSVQPTPSAEGVGWTYFTLRMTGMIHGWWNDPGMMEWCKNESGMRFS